MACSDSAYLVPLILGLPEHLLFVPLLRRGHELVGQPVKLLDAAEERHVYPGVLPHEALDVLRREVAFELVGSGLPGLVLLEEQIDDGVVVLADAKPEDRKS